MSRSCSVCSHAETATITREILAGGTNRPLAARFGVSRTAIQRHRVNCLKSPRQQKARAAAGGRTNEPEAARFASSGTIATPADLLERLRSLFRLGDLLEEAYDRRDVDACVKLAREYRAAAESYARVAGWMSDGVQVNVDARRQTLNVLAQLSIDELRALANVTDNQTLSAGVSRASDALEAETRPESHDNVVIAASDEAAPAEEAV